MVRLESYLIIPEPISRQFTSGVNKEDLGPGAQKSAWVNNIKIRNSPNDGTHPNTYYSKNSTNHKLLFL